MLVAGNTRTSGKRIGVDIDDVLYPWYERAHEVSVAAGITNTRQKGTESGTHVADY